MIEHRLITPEQLRWALEEQNKTGEKLGQVLVSHDLVTEIDLMKLLESQLGISRASIPMKVPAHVLHTITERTMRRYKVFPVGLQNNMLTVAMADPTNVLVVDELQQQTNREIISQLAAERQIDAAISRHFEVAQLEQEMMVFERETNTYNTLSFTEGDSSAVVRLVNSIINQAIVNGASDVHIEPRRNCILVRQRVDGMLREMMQLPLKAHSSVISRIKIQGEMDIAEKRLPQDGRILVEEAGHKVDLRVSTMPTVFGEKVVIRLLPEDRQLININQLGFSGYNFRMFKKLLRSTQGMILITGPTGSGKTTTLYAALNELNSPEKNLITIEEPVEYTINGVNQIAVNAKVGLTFASGLRSILRQDPDVIMVGEIRDQETARIAVRAATTGHLVLSTMHTNDAADAVTRLVDMGVESFLVAPCMVGVVAQRLVRRICPGCKESCTLNSEDRKLLPSGVSNLFRGRGCSMCSNTGYLGRVGIHEILIVNEEIKELIHRRAPGSQIKAHALAKGMVTLGKDAINKAITGETALEEVNRVTYTVN